MFTRIFVICELIIIFSCSLFSQEDVLVDVFPLKLGNRWIYRYYSIEYFLPECAFQKDSGRAEVKIISMDRYDDSLLWGFQEMRNVKHCILICAHPDQYQEVILTDTTRYFIVELLSGQHRLYRQGGNSFDQWISVLTYAPSIDDTALIFRYRIVDHNGYFSFRTHDRIYEAFDAFHHYRFQSGIGLDSINGEIPVFGEVQREFHHKLVEAILPAIEKAPRNEPSGFTLSQNFPNPFNPVTTISFSLPGKYFVTLKVVNVLGQEVARLVSEEKLRGEYNVSWDAGGLPSGVYYYMLIAGETIKVRTMVLVR